tara:strand:- start:3496 stop:3999 length:504 start_codon:yes stop_codon:yes gene_type:complete
MKKTSKIAAISLFSIAGLGLAGYLIYHRIAKLAGDNIGIKTLRVQEASLTKLKMSVYINFKNVTDMKIVLSKQEYEFFLNGVFLYSMKSDVEQVIYPKSISVLEANVDIDPKFVFQKIANSTADRLSLITNLGSQRLKLVTKLWIKFPFFSIPLTIPSEGTISEWKG